MCRIGVNRVYALLIGSFLELLEAPISVPLSGVMTRPEKVYVH